MTFPVRKAPATLVAELRAEPDTLVCLVEGMSDQRLIRNAFQKTGRDISCYCIDQFDVPNDDLERPILHGNKGRVLRILEHPRLSINLGSNLVGIVDSDFSDTQIEEAISHGVIQTEPCSLPGEYFESDDSLVRFVQSVSGEELPPEFVNRVIAGEKVLFSVKKQLNDINLLTRLPRMSRILNDDYSVDGPRLEAALLAASGGDRRVRKVVEDSLSAPLEGLPFNKSTKLHDLLSSISDVGHENGILRRRISFDDWEQSIRVRADSLAPDASPTVRALMGLSDQLI